MRKMPLTDAFFLINESRRTPMHVGGVNLFTLPDGVDDAAFLGELGDILSQEAPMRSPFGEKLKMGTLGALGPVAWEADEMLDLDYHIRHSALPKPGRYRELFSLVSRLHTSLLDRSRPLWEMHLIEGLQNRQIATYMKAHHCAIDGISAMHLTNSMLSSDPNTRITESPFSQTAHERYKKKLLADKPIIEPQKHEILAVTELLREQLDSTVHVARALQQFASVWMGLGGNLSVPWRKVPHTAFNSQITGARRFVAQSWPFERVRAVGKAFDGTLNDAVLAMCAGAFRRHLMDQGELPDLSLKAMAPVSLRSEGDIESGNAVGFLTADLGTNLADPAARIQTIQSSMAAAKGQLRGMSRREIEVYTIITQIPALMVTLTGLASRFPAFSTVVSNVPGPREQLYWNGARLDGIYPASIPFDGFAVNITLVSNNDMLDFGVVACRHTVPQVQRLIDYMDEALIELEEAAGLRAPAKAKAKAKRKRAGSAKKSTATSKRQKPRAKSTAKRKRAKISS